VNPEPTPWESAEKKLLYGPFGTRLFGGNEIQDIIKAACEEHAVAVTAELSARLKIATENWVAERDALHRTLLNREASLKQQSDEWVKAMTERDALRAELKGLQEANTEFANEHVALRTQLEQVVKGSFDASAVMATENATLRAQVKRLRELLVETRAFGLKPTPIQRGPLMVDWREERDKALADTQQEVGQ